MNPGLLIVSWWFWGHLFPRNIWPSYNISPTYPSLATFWARVVVTIIWSDRNIKPNTRQRWHHLLAMRALGILSVVKWLGWRITRLLHEFVALDSLPLFTSVEKFLWYKTSRKPTQIHKHFESGRPVDSWRNPVAAKKHASSKCSCGIGGKPHRWSCATPLSSVICISSIHFFHLFSIVAVHSSVIPS